MNSFSEEEIAQKVLRATKIANSEIRKRTIGYLAAAFGLVAGLAWNDAVRSLIDFVFPRSDNSVLAKFIYAIILTAAVAIFLYSLEKFFAKKEEK